MPVTTIKSSLVPLQLSLDAGVTYKTVVCRRSGRTRVSAPLTRDESDCGSFVDVGALQWGGAYEGIANVTPTTLSELSAEDVLGIIVSKASVLARNQSPAGSGTDLYIQGTVFLTNFEIVYETGRVVVFTFDFEGSGDPDVTP